METSELQVVVVVDTLDRKERKKSWLREADRGRKWSLKMKRKTVEERKIRKKGDLNHITGGMK